MPFTITNVDAQNLGASLGSTLTLTATAAAGTMLVLACSADNRGLLGVSSLSTTVTDTAGNTWVNRSLTNYTPGGAASDGITLGIWTCRVTAAMVAATVTLNFSPTTAGRAAILYLVTPGAGEMITVGSGVGPGYSGTGTAYTASAVSVTSGSTIFGFTALERNSPPTADSDTTNGSWSVAYTTTGVAGTSSQHATLSGQWKTVNATANQTYNTSNSSVDWALNYLILTPLIITGSAAGTSTAVGALGAVITRAGSAAGTSTAVGALGGAVTVAGSAAGTSTVLGALGGIVTLTGKAKGKSTAWAHWAEPPPLAPGTARSLRILARLDWAAGLVTTTRLWDGGGPWVDTDGEIWVGAGSFGSLDEIEQAINGEAATINLALSGVGGDESGLIWLAYTNEQIVGSTVSIFIQSCDANDQPIGSPELRFSGTIDDFEVKDAVADNRPTSTISVPVVNKFTVRRLKSGQVLSDGDQRSRSAILNPGAGPDLFCERVPMMQDKTITWPRWN